MALPTIVWHARALTWAMSCHRKKEEGGRPSKLSNKRPPCPPLRPREQRRRRRRKEGRKRNRGWSFAINAFDYSHRAVHQGHQGLPGTESSPEFSKVSKVSRVSRVSSRVSKSLASEGPDEKSKALIAQGHRKSPKADLALAGSRE